MKLHERFFAHDPQLKGALSRNAVRSGDLSGIGLLVEIPQLLNKVREFDDREC